MNGRSVSPLREPAIPVLVGECAYEGIFGACHSDVQRQIVWALLLTGCMGHTYGAQGVFLVNKRDGPYGYLPNGVCWGNEPWEDAHHLRDYPRERRTRLRNWVGETPVTFLNDPEKW